MSKVVRKTTTTQRANAQTLRSKRYVKVSRGPIFNFYMNKMNYILLGIGLIVIFLGFWFMSFGSWDSFASLDIAPIVLLLGYAVIVPAAILYRKKSVIVEEKTEVVE
ncbi:MAG: DUF3098 domain-containing protein [Syntrophothermus sp.]